MGVASELFCLPVINTDKETKKAQVKAIEASDLGFPGPGKRSAKDPKNQVLRL
jgi:hypothetical protein